MPLLGGLLGALPGGVLGIWLPLKLLDLRKRRRLGKFEKQLPDALELLARGLKAGHAFVSGLQLVADEMGEPIGPEFFKTFKEHNHGLDLNTALLNLCRRIDLPDLPSIDPTDKNKTKKNFSKFGSTLSPTGEESIAGTDGEPHERADRHTHHGVHRAPLPPQGPAERNAQHQHPVTGADPPRFQFRPPSSDISSVPTPTEEDHEVRAPRLGADPDRRCAAHEHGAPSFIASFWTVRLAPL